MKTKCKMVCLKWLFILLIFYQAAIAIKISNLLICFCSFVLSCPILEKYIFIQKKNIYLILLNSGCFFNLVCFYINFTVDLIEHVILSDREQDIAQR